MLIIGHESFEPEPDSSIIKFCSLIKTEYLNQFPNAWINGGYGNRLGESIMFVFGIQSPSQHQHLIEHNDPSRQIISIHDIKNGHFNQKITVENDHGYMSVSKEFGYRVKFGWRKKTATPDIIQNHIVRYFGKMKQIVEANKLGLPEDFH
jgi:hypothetical protein